MKVKLDEGAYLPERAHPTDAGLDLRSIESGRIPPHDSMNFNTGVHVELPPGTCGLLVAKSGLNSHDGVTSTGLIDAGYTGAIKVTLQNNSGASKVIRKGDKISQLVVLPCFFVGVEEVDYIYEDTDRGPNGFGSTGR